MDNLKKEGDNEKRKREEKEEDVEKMRRGVGGKERNACKRGRQKSNARKA